MRTLTIISIALASLAACAGDLPPTTGGPSPDDPGLPGGSSGTTAGGEGNTEDHPNPVDPWDVLDRLLAEGPPSYSAHVHSCMKTKYATLGRVLAQRGVNLAATGALSAGALYKGGDQALGVANYGQRVAESVELTTAGASKMLDIFASAAPEIIAAMPNRAECMVNGQPTQMFDAQNNCTAAGIECITGLPASPAIIEVCSQSVLHASTPDKGKNLAVAITMAAAHACE